MGDDSLSDTGRDCTFDDCSYRVHGSDDLRLELGWDVELDLLEKVFRGTETTNDEDVLESSQHALTRTENCLQIPVTPCSVPGWR